MLSTYSHWNIISLEIKRKRRMEKREGKMGRKGDMGETNREKDKVGKEWGDWRKEGMKERRNSTRDNELARDII